MENKSPEADQSAPDTQETPPTPEGEQTEGEEGKFEGIHKRIGKLAEQDIARRGDPSRQV